jgi:hypothetical protein
LGLLLTSAIWMLCCLLFLSFNYVYSLLSSLSWTNNIRSCNKYDQFVKTSIFPKQSEILLLIREVPGSYLYPEYGCPAWARGLWFSSVVPDKCKEGALKGLRSPPFTATYSIWIVQSSSALNMNQARCHNDNSHMAEETKPSNAVGPVVVLPSSTLWRIMATVFTFLPYVLDQWYSTRGPQKIFWNTKFLNKVRADIGKLVKRKQRQVSH